MMFMPGVRRKLGDAAQDQRLVGGLLRVLAEEHDPAGVERAVNVVVSAVHVERVLGQRAGAHFEHHRRALAGRVVVLLNAVDNALAGGEVDHALAADGVSNGAALGRVLAFGLNGDGVAAEDVQVALSIGLLEELAAFGGRRDGIKNAGIGDARLSVVRDKLVSVGGNSNAGVASSFCHESLSVSPVLSANHCARALSGADEVFPIRAQWRCALFPVFYRPINRALRKRFTKQV